MAGMASSKEMVPARQNSACPTIAVNLPTYHKIYPVSISLISWSRRLAWSSNIKGTLSHSIIFLFFSLGLLTEIIQSNKVYKTLICKVQMHKKWVKSWKRSVQPRKQRVYRVRAPLHVKRRFLGANLSKDLRKKYGGSAVLRKGDVVRVMRGEFKKKRAKVDSVEILKGRVSLEGIQRTKKDGTKVMVSFAPSNLQIVELNLEDKKRKAALERAEKKETGESENLVSDKRPKNKIAKRKK